MNKLETFIEKSRKRHGDKYDYSKVQYVDSLTKVCIVCPEHGEFWQTPQGHVRGYECPECAKKRQGKRSNVDEFIAKAKEVHGEKYDYSKVNYVNAMTKVTIICPTHGEFEMIPMNHIMGQGCPKCHGRGLTQEEVIERFKEVHGDKYDYSQVVFTKMHEKVKIICPKHGEFYQTPAKHYSHKQGCPKCGKESMSLKRAKPVEDFVKVANELYNGKYDYSQVEYKNSHERIKIICPQHGEFWQLPYDHLHGHSCPHCGVVISKGEDEVYEYVCSLLGKDNVIRSERTILKPYEIDIYVPSLHIGIEYNGIRWHSSLFREKNYHLNKLKLANSNGVELIQIFEDEWVNKKDIVKAKLRRVLKCDKDSIKVMARKCHIKEISKKEAGEFLNKNHIQGYKGCSIAIGCFFNEKLVAVMTFERSLNEWTLNRYASDNSMICQGVGGKLFSYFIKTYHPEYVKSFADLRWTTNVNDNLYTKIGFKLDGFIDPQYRYINTSKACERIHKFNFRKKILAERYGADISKSEDEITKELGYAKIFDCGLAKYVWKV